jgi:hypothetical protein
MTQDEKDRLIEFFDDEKRWCRGTDATDKRGQLVHYDDEKAVSWDIVGGLCHLFGWKRASRLFEPISRQLTGRHHAVAPMENQEIAAMSALLDFNDDDGTTHDLMMARFRELPVWHRIRDGT